MTCPDEPTLMMLAGDEPAAAAAVREHVRQLRIVPRRAGGVARRAQGARGGAA